MEIQKRGNTFYLWLKNRGSPLSNGYYITLYFCAALVVSLYLLLIFFCYQHFSLRKKMFLL